MTTSASNIEEPSSTEGKAIVAESVARSKPQPLGSVLASAQRVTSRTIDRTGSVAKSKAWQDDAWEMFNLVGEQRFLATTLAGRLSQANLYVGKVSPDPAEPPEPVTTGLPFDIFEALGKTSSARAQIIARLGINLFVAGDGWIVGIPKRLMPVSQHPTGEFPRPDLSLIQQTTAQQTSPYGDIPVVPDGLTLDDLVWRMLSVSEVSSSRGGEITLRLGENPDEQIMVDPDDIFLIRVWRPHPRYWWEADSPTRSSLPVLRELVGLTMHISAQVDSRLAGAGVFIVPQSASRAIKIAAGLDPDDDSDPFTEALMEAMLTPIEDRSNASATVPLVVAVPDEAADKFRHISFSTQLDQEARQLRDEAIRRLALGQDAPPELLLGVGGMNHWGAWLVREDVVTTHIEPPLALICDAITTQYLWPILTDQGMSEEQAQQYVIWYDVSHMVMRPNRFADAKELHGVGAINDETLREAGGFSEQDAPTDSGLDMATVCALDLVKQNPALINEPGLPAVVSQLREVLGIEAEEPSSEEPTVEETEPESDVLPEEDDSGDMPEPDAEPESIAASVTETRSIRLSHMPTGHTPPVEDEGDEDGGTDGEV